MKANLPQAEPRRLEALEGGRASTRQVRDGAQGRAAVRAARRAALRERPHPPRHRAQQDPEGRRRAQPHAWRATTRPTCPGWDCHGLPIELQVDKDLGSKKKEMSPVAFRQACRAYAEKFVDIQREEFERLGVLGEWDDPYLTMAPATRPTIVRAARRRSWRRASSTRPRSPCTGASRAAPRWPRPRSSTTSTTTSPSIDVRFPLADEDARRARAAASRPSRAGACPRSSGRRRPGRCPPTWPSPSIPTRTTRSIPVEGARRGPARSPRRCARPRGARWKRRGPSRWASRWPMVKGAAFEGAALPPSLDRPRLARRARRLRHARHRHRRRAHRARPRLGRLPDRRALRPRHLLPGGRGAAASCPRSSTSRARRSSTPTRRSSTLLREKGALLASGKETPLLSRLLALQEPDHLPRHRAVVHRPRRRGGLRERALEAIAQGALVSRPGARSASAT